MSLCRVLLSRRRPSALVGRMESYQGIRPWQTNRLSSKVQLRLILGTSGLRFIPITAVEAWSILLMPIWFKRLLGIMGQTYQPNMFVLTNNLESAMGNFVRHLLNMVLGFNGVDLPDESMDLRRKNLIWGTISIIPLVSLTTTHRCS